MLPLERDGCPAMRVLPAGEYERYTEASRAAFWRGEWKITPQSDRYGFRLAGEALRPIAPMELRSHGIVPGVIQVPHNGQPIIQMRDAQPSGGAIGDAGGRTRFGARIRRGLTPACGIRRPT